ncbi:tRNA-dihydrouridine(20a/20b) synthase [NAD(P)+]-like [Watersipora subatra]|uniref:tRNA-dihydrouridine(20a/20b) synthase [NAD(P)+]-like n=1 Tax=Watersipora subatra TaxID=2589382 RepID=UPI00355BC17D
MALGNRCDIVQMLESEEVTKICAPMVRYSKLAFRTLVRKYGCDLAFTPMIIAESFSQSQHARDADFTTSQADRPLVVQFAAKNGKYFADVAEMVAPYSDGVDLNCGCPQRWAIQEGYGACLIDKPELISDMVSQARNRITVYPFSVSVKIRIHDELRRTVDFCRQVEAAGVSFITVHGRTKAQRAEPVNVEAVRLIKENLSVPVIHNGDVTSLERMQDIVGATGVNGVMAARGILENPAMYAGHGVNREVLSDWVEIAMNHGTQFPCFHHHTHTMLQNCMSKPERRVFNTFQSTAAILDYLDHEYGISSDGSD